MNEGVMTLDVLLHDTAIGSITRTAGDATIFAFNDAYAEDASRPTLGLSFKTAAGRLRTQFRAYQTRLAPWFSNLLPEGPLRQYLADRGGVHQDREFFLLRLLGEDLPGALRIRPARDSRLPPAFANPVQAASADASQGFESAALRFSLAGVQLKFSAISQTTGGLTIPARGVGGDWIVKLPSERFEDVPANEFSMMSLASRLGMTVPETRLVQIKDIQNLPEGLGSLRERQALAVKRFDRSISGAVHMEDFAQVFELYPEQKYKKASAMNIAAVLGVTTPQEDVAEFSRRLVFNALIGNSDMHAKNWSLIYPDRHHPRLAPAYDFLNTTAYLPDDSSALKFSRSRRYVDLTLDELAHLANRARVPEHLVLSTARQTVERFHQVWAQERDHLPVPEPVKDAIERQLKQVPLARV